MSEKWTNSEIDASVDVWVEMLSKQTTDEQYRKIDYIRKLRNGELHNRSKGSVEWRFQNITAVAIALDSNWVNGYPPAVNVGGHWGRIQNRLQHHGIGANEDEIERMIQAETEKIMNSPSADELSDFEKYRVRERSWQLVTNRQGHSKFRNLLLEAYGVRGAITRADAKNGLQAAHIEPYDGPISNIPTNGLLLRADIHLLFDSGLLGIEPDGFTTVLSPELKNSAYAQHDGQRIIIPEKESLRPDKVRLDAHLKLAMSYW